MNSLGNVCHRLLVALNPVQWHGEIRFSPLFLSSFTVCWKYWSVRSTRWVPPISVCICLKLPIF